MAGHPSPAQVAGALAAHRVVEVPPFPGRENPERAGVLVPLCWDPDPVCLLTERAATLREHGGEVSFPGGKARPGEDLLQAATREAREEIGAVVVANLGALSSIPVFTSHYRLVPFVAHIRGEDLRPNPAEVARLVPFRLAEVLARPHIDAVGFELHGRAMLSPVFPTEGRTMYGATAHVFHELLRVMAPLYGVEVPPLVTGTVSWESLRR